MRRKSLLVTLLMAAASVPAFATPAPSVQPPQYDLRIARQSLSSALQEFAKQSGVQIIFFSRVTDGHEAAPLSGKFTAVAALGRLLNGAPELAFRELNANTIEVLPKEAVNRLDAAYASSSRGGGTGESVLTEGDGKAKGFWSRLRLAQTEPASKADTQGAAVEDQGNTQSSNRIGLEEIIVTAQKRSERLKDIPISIAVISSQDIERRGLIGMEDYLRSIPGVNQIDSAIFNAIVIRGITTSPNFENLGSGTTVASYFDETPITGAGGLGGGGIDIRPVDIERIEVLRGPQGTTYGSSSLGGAMRMIPANPKLDGFSAKLVASYSGTTGNGSENSMIQGVLNIPVVADQFALRAVGYRYDESGFYRNIAGIHPGTIAFAENFGLGDFVRGHVQDDVGRMRSTGGRVAALWEATDRLNISLNYLTQKTEQDGRSVATIGKYEQAVTPIAPEARMRGEVGEINDTEMDLVNVVLNYDLRWAALTSAVSSVDAGSVWMQDFSRAFRIPGSATTPSDFESFTAEVRLASQLEGRFQFLGGLFYEDVENEEFQTLDWPGTPATNPVGTDPTFFAHLDFQRDQSAVFGEVSYDLTDKITATVGGRYFEYKKEERTLIEGGFVGVPIGAGIAPVLESSEDGSTFKANLGYKPTQDSLLYASWTEGFRLGRPSAGLPSAACDTDGDGLVDGTNISNESTRTINSDFLENYEIGGKFTLFDRRMVVDTAVYRIEWDGLPALTIANCSGGSIAFTTNVGAATSSGVEFQASLLVMDGLRLDFGAGYTKAELSKDAPGLGVQKGARLPGSPEVSANLSAQYDFDVAGYKAFVRADSFHTGEFFSDLRETPGFRAGDYIKVDARAGVEIKNLSMELFVRNLTNEDAFTWRAANGDFGLRPRTLGIQLGYRFE